ncbi:MAG: RagB/SusD family nutrient uptake outer membrane protein [Paraprevotella sp.]|nr:RagB/SusD family nutrient uptake outer membrane protein [Paraprevotella sp.]
MKKYFSFILTIIATAISLSLSSCSDWLELMPEDSTIEEEFWKNGNQVESVVRACYRYMQEDNLMQRIILWGELRSDEVQNGPSLSSAEAEIVNANVKSNNSWCNWASFYTVINYCNKVLEYAPSVRHLDANFSEATCNAYLAEAHTLRALCYFYLLRTFRDVPLVLESSKTDEYDYNVSNRDTLAWINYYHLPVSVTSFTSEAYPMINQENYVLDRMIEDLKLAKDYAATEWESEEENRGRVTRRAVEALLADYYLWRASVNHTIDAAKSEADYRECIALCNSILNQSADMEDVELAQGANLLQDVFYNGNSYESIFELNFTTNGYANNATSTLYGNTVKSRNPHLLAAVGLQALFNQSKASSDEADYDFRSKDFFNPKDNRIFKYEGQTPPTEFNSRSATYTFRSSSSQANWIFYRLADIYLMKAEATAQIATTADEVSAVVTLCNKTYIRACTDNSDVRDSLDHATYASPSDAQRLVLEERQRELMFEGKRWFDLLRLARRNGSTTNSWQYIESRYDEDVTTIRNKMTSIEAWYLPIYLNETKINGNLRQNTYYESQDE